MVWRGKDEQDWSDLVVHAPPLYIQEKIHPKALIDDLLRRSQARHKAAEAQLDLFADFNGLPEGDARTEFYRHDANWTNRMILGDSLKSAAAPYRSSPAPNRRSKSSPHNTRKRLR